MTKTIKEVSIDNMIDEICKQYMIDKICKRYGFEVKETISFCRLCEESNNYKLIRKKYQKLMERA